MNGEGARTKSSSDAAYSRIGFSSTCWSTVRRAGADGHEREGALDRLIRQYRPALKHYLTSHFRMDASTADDVVQGFLLDKILKRNLLNKASEDRGKFRTFLLTAIHRYTLDFLRRAVNDRIKRKRHDCDQTDSGIHRQHPGTT
jgi:DNA-directed RNA polymerase specialized sigma24 family protein